MTLLEQDKRNRERIATEIDRNFFVEASAGSGKTTALVTRMAAMVAGGIPVEQICAITFTKAAAKEFYIRFAAKLDELRHSDAPERTKQLYAHAFEYIDLCFMGTIDAFCNKLLSEHPVEAGVPMDTALLEDAAMRKVLRREWQRMKRGDDAYGKQMQALYAAFAQWQERPDDAFESCVVSFMNTRNTQRIYNAPRGESPDEMAAGVKAELVEILDAIEKHPHCVKAGNAQQSKLEALRAGAGVIAGTWNGHVGKVLRLLETMNELRLVCPPEEVGIRHTRYFRYPEGRKHDWVLCIDEGSDVRRRLEEERYSVTVQMMSAFAAAAAPILKARGELGFFDYQLYLRDMLLADVQQGGALIKHIAGRHKYFLVDEFQDTDPLQSEILFLLTAQEPVPDWTACVPRPGALFIVGDPKQSIYRFRGADVGSFMKVRALFSGDVGEVLQLYCNFRSLLPLRSWFNQRFAALLPETTPFQSRYDEIPDHGTSPPEGFFGAYQYVSTKDDDPNKVADIIESLVDSPNRLAMRDAPSRPIEYRDIMVITRAKTHMLSYMQAFAQRGIPVHAEGRTRFSQCGVLRALVAVLEALAAPLDSAAVYAALRSELFDVSQADILRHRDNGGALTLYADAGDDAVLSALGELRALRERAKGRPASAVLALSEWMLDGFVRMGTVELPYYYYALELLRSAEAGGGADTLADISKYLRRLLNNAEERSLELDQQVQGVHLANLHKVKGLESTIVILAGVNSGASKVSCALDREAGSSTFIRIGEPQGSAYAQTRMQPDAEERERQHLRAETLRLKYVAATRAKHALIIAKRAPGERGGEEAWSGLTDGLPVYEAGAAQAKPSRPQVPAAYAREEETLRGAMLQCARPTYAITRPSLMKVKSKTAAEDEYDDMIAAEIERAFPRRNAALVGTLVHSLMELLVQTDADGATLAAQVVEGYDLPREQASELAQLLSAVAARMRCGGYAQANSASADLLAELRDARTVLCEVPFCVREDQMGSEPALLHGVMDLIYENDEGWHIIDYKTNAEATALDEKYENQLTAYRTAFRQMTEHSADAAIYHIDV